MYLSKNNRKIISLFMVFIIVCSCFSSGAFAASALEKGQFVNTSVEKPTVSADEIDTMAPSESNVSFTLVERTHSIKVTAKYKDGTTRDVTSEGVWTSLDPAIVKVANGVLTAVSTGSTQVRLMLDNAIVNVAVTITSGERSAFKALEVASDPQLVTVLLSKINVFVSEDTYSPISLTGIYSDGSIADLTDVASWSSENPEIAIVTHRFIKGIAAGNSTRIKAVYPNLPPLFIAVTVQKEAVPYTPEEEWTGLKISDLNLKLLLKDDPYPLHAYLDYPLLGDYEVTTLGNWSIEDPHVATIDANGVVTPVGKGYTYAYFDFKFSAPTGSEGEKDYFSGWLRNSVLIFVEGLSTIDVYPSNDIVMKPGSYVDLELTGRYPMGRGGVEIEDLTSKMTWTVEDKSIATINDIGRIFTGTGNGTTKITGKYGNNEVEITVTVSDEYHGQILNIVAEPSHLEMTKGTADQQPRIKAIFSDGYVEDITASTDKSNWWSSDSSIAYRTDEGYITAESEGSAVVRAQYFDEVGNDMEEVIIPIIVKASAPRAAASVPVTADRSFGLANMNRMNENALAEDQSVAVLLLSSTQVFIRKGESFPVKLFAVKKDGTQEDVTNQAFWETDETGVHEGIAEVTQEGIVIGKSTGYEYDLEGPKLGKTFIQVTYGSFPPIKIPVTVREKDGEHDPLFVFAVDPQTAVPMSSGDVLTDGDDLRLYNGIPYKLDTKVVDSYHVTHDAEGVWSFERPDLVQVNEEGAFVAKGTGRTNATFTYYHEAMKYTLELHLQIVDLERIEADVEKVSEDQYHTIEIHPNGSTLLTLKEVYKDHDGETHAEEVTGVVTWTAEDPQVAGIVSEGPFVRIFGDSLGSTKVTAEYFGKKIEFDITVTNNPISPRIMTIVADPTHYFINDSNEITPVIKAIYSDGSVREISNTDLLWQSGNYDIARITDDGNLKGQSSKGGTVVYATYKGVGLKVPVIVTYAEARAPVATDLKVTPNLKKLAVGGTQQLKVETIYSDGSVMDSTDLAIYQSLNPDIATVNKDGVVQGRRPGTTEITVFHYYFTERLTVVVEAAAQGPSEPLQPSQPSESLPVPVPGSEVAPTPVPQPVNEPAPAPTMNKKLTIHAAVDEVALKEKAAKALASTMEVKYSDLSKTSWSFDAIKLATRMGFVQGYKEGSFHPKTNVTRAEFAVMLARVIDLKPTASSVFKDINQHWAAGSINALQENGLISGYGDGTFKPNQAISRAEIATIVSRMIDFGKATKESSFKDVNNHWAADAINALSEAGVVQGKGSSFFAPDDHASREEAVVLILRALNAGLDLGLKL